MRVLAGASPGDLPRSRNSVDRFDVSIADPVGRERTFVADLLGFIRTFRAVPGRTYAKAPEEVSPRTTIASANAIDLALLGSERFRITVPDFRVVEQSTHRMGALRVFGLSTQ